MTTDQAEMLALYGVPGVGAKTCARLIKSFGSPGNVFTASKRELKEVEGIGEVLSEAILSFDRDGFVATQERLMKKSDAHMIARDDDEYPPILNMFPSAPPVLFVRGDVRALKKASIAIVGTRAPSAYGTGMTRTIAAEAVRSGYCIVSGMAAGIDTAAHKSALEAGGLTVAVFGCGVDTIYPPGNEGLSRDIMRSGCLVSHFPMGAMSMPGNFPARNSVIVGLSFGTIVTEAPMKSGALITANLSLRAGRPLFAVPGSDGTNSLLALGAHPATSFADVLGGMGKKNEVKQAPKPKLPEPEGFRGEILDALKSKPLFIENLCAILNRPVSVVLSELTLLEIDGYVIQKPGKIFERL